MQTNYIIFFDGHCNLCNRFIDFVMKFDKKERFYFGSLQGESSSKLLTDPSLHNLKTVVLLKDDEIYTKSAAVIEIFGVLWPFLGLTKILKVVPFKDYIYDFISKNRYSLFGRQDTCRLPTKEEQRRFLP